MLDNMFTRNDGYAFGLERSGFKVATMVKERYNRKEPEVERKAISRYERLTYENKNNPLLYKTPRHG